MPKSGRLKNSKGSDIDLPRGMSQLTPRRQELIRAVFERPQQYVLLSVRDLATRLGTDPATVVRIVQRLGFESYRAFQLHLHQLSMARATPLHTMRAGATAGATPQARLRQALEKEVQNVDGLLNTLDLSRLATAAARLWDARRILVVGGDLAATLVSYLEYHLGEIGLASSSATAPGLAVHSVRGLGPDDVMIAISFRRGLRMTVQALQQASKQGVFCIGITDTSLSPIARLADEVFLASVEAGSFVSSYAAPIALLSMLLAACAEARRDATLRWMKKVEVEQRNGFRWYSD